MTWLKKLLAVLRQLLSALPVNSGGGSSPPPAPDNPPDAGGAEYLVTPGRHQERTITVPCSLAFTISDKSAGDPQQEQVTLWAVTAGENWNGGNPKKGVFSVRVNDYSSTQIKCKVYGTDGVAREPKLNVAWPTPPVHRVKLEVRPGFVQLTVDGSNLLIECPTPPMVTLFYGDPQTRKAAMGAKITDVAWEGKA